jgi:hypothetical protein
MTTFAIGLITDACSLTRQLMGSQGCLAALHRSWRPCIPAGVLGLARGRWLGAGVAAARRQQGSSGGPADTLGPDDPQGADVPSAAHSGSHFGGVYRRLVRGPSLLRSVRCSSQDWIGTISWLICPAVLDKSARDFDA